MRFYVYILYSETTEKYYVGCCEGMNLRLQQPNTGRNISRSSGKPWIIKQIEDYSTLGEAKKREAYNKIMKSRKFTEMVISGDR